MTCFAEIAVLRAYRFDAEGPRQRERRLARAQAELGGERDALLCCACQTLVTHRSAALDVDGAHTHQFTNPLGLQFAIGCFSVAPGCRPAGAAVVEHTWFPGTRWQVASCHGCDVHLGWRYTGRDQVFFGLILDRLCSADEQ